MGSNSDKKEDKIDETTTTTTVGNIGSHKVAVAIASVI